MNGSMTNRSRTRQRRILKRLDKFNFPRDLDQPMIRATNIQYEVAERSIGTPYGGIGLIHQLAKTLGLPAAIDERLHLFKIHLPYHESDHVLNIAFNILAGGKHLEHLELRRNDEVYLNALGAQRIPDPTRGFRSEASVALRQSITNDKQRNAANGNNKKSTGTSSAANLKSKFKFPTFR